MSESFSATECRHQLLDALREELKHVPACLHGMAGVWIAEEGFKALAHSHGTIIAAQLAYRIADELATAGSVRR